MLQTLYTISHKQDELLQPELRKILSTCAHPVFFHCEAAIIDGKKAGWRAARQCACAHSDDCSFLSRVCLMSIPDDVGERLANLALQIFSRYLWICVRRYSVSPYCSSVCVCVRLYVKKYSVICILQFSKTTKTLQIQTSIQNRRPICLNKNSK